MKLVVGLGNPGKEYERTRHNVGFMVIDALAVRVGDAVMLVKPDTFMNRSGEAVRKIVNSYQLPVDSLYVVHDDLDIPLGKYKIQRGRGPKDHRGVLSVEMALGRKDFWRVRVGIDNRHEDVLGDKYVLSQFPAEELTIVDRVIEQVVGELCSKWETG